ncbi:MAG TPA: Asp-tRNA(Asn)/Glu-tRNA(Gln) amidotransferase subunit GatC [Planctomycetota bacterium]|nr:Asp-tRNA(Asn)/Glu-tRNA(Gln) amidotransferase subunit GatC [Planctomycetota bacterium]
MSITEQDVRHLCKLSNLAISDAEMQRMAGELEAIVGYVQQLQVVDTTGVEPIANVAGLVNVTRPDVAGQMLDQRQVLSNAPAKNDVAILVPKAVER